MLHELYHADRPEIYVGDYATTKTDVSAVYRAARAIKAKGWATTRPFYPWCNYLTGVYAMATDGGCDPALRLVVGPGYRRLDPCRTCSPNENMLTFCRVLVLVVYGLWHSPPKRSHGQRHD